MTADKDIYPLECDYQMTSFCNFEIPSLRDFRFFLSTHSFIYDPIWMKIDTACFHYKTAIFILLKYDLKGH